MKKIGIKIIVVLFIVFIADRLLGYVFTRYIFEKTLSGESGGNLNYLLQKKKNADYIILGTSRAKHQIDPEKLTSIKGIGYNAGVNGIGAIIFNNILLEIILHEKLQPKIVLLQTDVVNFVAEASENTVYGLSYLYPYRQKSKLLQTLMNRQNFEEQFKLHSDLYKFNGKIPSIFLNYCKRNTVTDNNGFVPWVQTMDTTKQNGEPFSYDNGFAFSAAKLQALNNIISLCERNNIKLFIILPPYYKNVNYKKDDLSFLKKYIKDKSRKVIIIDMADVSNFPDLQNAQNWKDIGHLNNIGAAKFSTYLNDSLKNNLQ